MKALTLTQPWATLVAMRLKNIETRSWYAHYRGDLAIHAAKGFPGWAKDFAREERDALGCDPDDLPLGKLLCTRNLAACERTELVHSMLSADEKRRGNYEGGRFAFMLNGGGPLRHVTVRGALGLWDVPEEIMTQAWA